MSKVTLNETSFAWKQIAQNWVEYFDSPSRPSISEINQYNKWLKQISKGRSGLKGLVLGATPELRDALYENKFDVYIIDINLEMIFAMAQLLKNNNPDEIVIRSNWLDNPLKSNYFDVILGDAVLPNLPWDKRELFYKEIKRLLKKGGYFLNRAFFVPQIKSYKTSEEILAAFAKKKASNKTAIELVFEIQILTHNSNDRLGSMEKVAQVVEKLHGKKGFNSGSKELNETLDILYNYWIKMRKKVWIYPYEKEEEAEYKRYFKTEEKFCASDHPYGLITPMYLLKSI